jgi:hypothetical protein
MSVKSALRRMSRAFSTKDERAFDEAMEELEEKMEGDKSRDGEDPDTIEVHNHIPDSMMRDGGLGLLPGKDPPGFDRHSRDGEGEEAPAWFKKHEEAVDARFKKVNDALENLGKYAQDRRDWEDDPEHPEDRRRDDDEAMEENLEHSEDRRRDDDRRLDDDTDPNLEMDRRRNNDRRDRRDRHGRDRRDEANKEILGELEFEAPPGTGDKARKARDSQYLEDAFQDAVAKAEVLVPGITLPTFDRKAPPTKTFGQIARLRATALDLAYNQPTTRGVIDQAMSGRTLDTKSMRFGSTRVLFNAAAAATAQGNNHRATDRSTKFEPNGGARVAARDGGIQSIADINRVNREKYARR